MKQPRNEPAFTQQCMDAGEVGLVHEGMSLRDYFAIRTLQALMRQAGGRIGDWDEAERDRFSIEAYMMADAMLVARDLKI